MNENIYKLVDILVKSDFLSIEPMSQVVAKKSLNYKFTDPFEISRSIKEFLRSLKDVRSKGKVVMNIYVEDKFKKYFLEMCFKEANLIQNINIITSIKEVQKLSKENQFLLIIGYPKERKYRDLLLNQFYRFHVINNRGQQRVDGCYVIHTSMSDVKKLVFLVILILKVIKA